ncbi:LysM peptidoglycan-binding domain-containing protein [Streptomyces sp. SID5785]|uniref:transglycosylase family protein n=1 Tax=Streptomyces sp. SID5785 TaxID=2690309 RepID=UPI00136186B0|nr:transglycosylase family protein [Streptomyces sp. SID5785]MZD09032.1 LysM peptidoglycan-binding domain-containing protein [Streptomyces sp. SID5785]
MLSGNGRHRRPRQAPALVVAAGVTGSAIAIPLLAATNASAADTHAWDKLATCESGGQWSLDAGNGYYGGLQLSQEMWEQYGGLDFAPSADQASRSQQISVAEKVLDDRGPGAWPSCSLTAGLTQGDGSAEVDPGSSLLPSPSAPDASESPSDEASGDTSGNASSGASDDDGKTDKKDGKGEQDDQGEKGEGAGAAEGSASPSPSAAPSGDDESGESGKSGSGAPTSPEGSAPEATPSSPDGSDGGRHRGDRASDDRADSRTGEGRHASREDSRGGDAYTVRAGDNLWDIADSHDVDGGWAALYDLNKKTVGSDPDLILPGQSLDLGLESGEK